MIMGLPKTETASATKRINKNVFDKINKNVAVNWAPVRICHSDRTGDSGRDIFENENLITRKIKEINRASPSFGSDSPFGSDRAPGSLQNQSNINRHRQSFNFPTCRLGKTTKKRCKNGCNLN